jgi:hypothetical protein
MWRPSNLMRGVLRFVGLSSRHFWCACVRAVWVLEAFLTAVVGIAQVCIFYLVLRALDTVGQ